MSSHSLNKSIYGKATGVFPAAFGFFILQTSSIKSAPVDNVLGVDTG